MIFSFLINPLIIYKVKMNIKISRAYLYVVLFILMTASCVPYEKLKYTQDIEGAQNEQFTNIREEKKIKPFDNLNVKIYSLDPKVSAIFTDEEARNLDVRYKSYTVSKEGYITLPFIDKINVKDLTIDEARVKIEEKMNSYLNDISVMIRFVGNRITVLGEVRQQGEYGFYDEKITIFQALSYANGIADFGNREAVTIIREEDGLFTYHTLDLTRKDVVESEFYYLLPNDIIIVNPIKAKYRYLRDYALLGTIFSTITTIAVLVNVIFNIQN